MSGVCHVGILVRSADLSALLRYKETAQERDSLKAEVAELRNQLAIVGSTAYARGMVSNAEARMNATLRAENDRLAKEVERLNGYLKRIKESPDGSIPVSFMARSLSDDCSECAAKNQLADEALQGGGKVE